MWILINWQNCSALVICGLDSSSEFCPNLVILLDRKITKHIAFCCMNIAQQPHHCAVTQNGKSDTFCSVLLTNKYLDVISSAKASTSTKQICGVIGGRFYQQVDFSPEQTEACLSRDVPNGARFRTIFSPGSC